ncbi:MAG: glycosyltransferase family 4 protein [Bacteroidales bacterium]
MLADILSSYYYVKLAGFNFNKNSCNIWKPLENIDQPIDIYPGRDFPEFSEVLKAAALKNTDADIIVVCKPRLPSMQLGLMMKSFHNRPLVLDIDDYELGFFKDRVTKMNEDDIRQPHGEIWTNYCENLIRYADGIIVSNSALSEKYGGVVIPHARNESIFNPEFYSKQKRRKELEISLEDKVVLFLGTPRKHKGLLELSKAINLRGSLSYKLCIMGSFPDEKFKESLIAVGKEHLILFPDQPFGDIPKNIAIADLVCLLQDEGRETSRYQLPAKVIDALAMGVPVLATETPALKPLIDQGVVIKTNRKALPDDIERIISNLDLYKNNQLEKRHVFIDEYSYGAVYKKFEKVINDTIINHKELPNKALVLIELQEKIFNHLKKQMDPSKQYPSDQKEKMEIVNKEFKKIEKERRKFDMKYKIMKSKIWPYIRPFHRAASFVKRYFKMF